MDFEFYKIETFMPEEYVEDLRKHLNDIGALTLGGCYDNCMSISKVKSFWRPLDGAKPFNGEVGSICEAEEVKVEFCCRKEALEGAVKIIKKVHPYEKPVINILPNYLKS